MGFDELCQCFKRNLGQYGKGGPGLNAYHLDRMGWLDRRKILRFGAARQFDRKVSLTVLTRPNAGGYNMVRIPFDVNDLYHYYTVEYRVPEGWDSGIGSDRVLIHEVITKKKTKCSSGIKSAKKYRSYLLRKHTGKREPKESINRNGVRIDVVSKNPSTGKAVVRIRSTRPDRCVLGRVWREARPSDHVCVKPARRAQVRRENKLGPARRRPGGGTYGPDTCKKGYVWREAYPGDHVCLRKSGRTKARNENRIAFEKRIGGAAYGPNTCKKGYVWREADQRDWVCVKPARRAQVRRENKLGPARRRPGGGPPL